MTAPEEVTCRSCHHPDHDEGECAVRFPVFGPEGWTEGNRCTCTGPPPPRTGPVTPDPWMDPDAAARMGPPPF